MVVCRSLRKDGDGELAVLMNWPGRISREPNTASAGENLLSSLNEALLPSITHVRWLCQSAAADAPPAGNVLPVGARAAVRSASESGGPVGVAFER